MKTAHQGLAPVGLPGIGGAGWMTAPRTDAGNAGATAAPPSPPALDSWLLDKLFGRH